MTYKVGTILVGGREAVVTLAKVGLDDDRRPWRVEAPGAVYDGWLMGDADLLFGGDA